MQSTLSVYCQFKGWQGENIHQALQDFFALPMDQKDKFCNMVFEIGTENISDIENFGNFTRARIGF